MTAIDFIVFDKNNKMVSNVNHFLEVNSITFNEKNHHAIKKSYASTSNIILSMAYIVRIRHAIIKDIFNLSKWKKISINYEANVRLKIFKIKTVLKDCNHKH